MEQRLNNRMDLHFQGLKDSYFAEFQKLSVLIRGDQNIVDRNNSFRNLRIISTTPSQSSSYFITVDIVDVVCRIAKRLSVSSLSVRLRDKERTEVLGWGYAERKSSLVTTKLRLTNYSSESDSPFYGFRNG
ncbi:hypothetical protein Lal_00043167 [Lupinus albus]|nr:hypothetical protein Lal_00043167 [Lupinus albus]